jgi:2-dehydropantoate 2-reductase
MHQIKTVLIAGAGAIGSMVAWQLYNHNPRSVSLLARNERLARYQRDGFVINGTPCHFHLANAASRSNPDLVIIACKFHQLDALLADLANHIGPHTLILSLLNGISSEERIAAAFGAHRIPYAMIIGADAGYSGNRTTYTNPGIIYFGDAENSLPWSPRVTAIADFFQRSGIACTVPENMLNRLWFKFMLNVGVNQITAISRKPYRILQSAGCVPEAMQLLDDAMREVISVAAAEGITLTETDIDSVHRTMDILGDEGKTSMCQDVEAGRKTEVELFSGTVMDLGKKHNIPVPVNTVLYQLLKTIEVGLTG